MPRSHRNEVSVEQNQIHFRACAIQCCGVYSLDAVSAFGGVVYVWQPVFLLHQLPYGLAHFFCRASCDHTHLMGRLSDDRSFQREQPEFIVREALTYNDNGFETYARRDYCE